LGIGCISERLLDSISELFVMSNELTPYHLGLYSNEILNIGYFENGSLINTGNELRVPSYTEGDIITIVFNTKNGELTILKNNGRVYSCRGVNESLYIMVNMNASSNEIPCICEIVESSF